MGLLWPLATSERRDRTAQGYRRFRCRVPPTEEDVRLALQTAVRFVNEVVRISKQ
jgi:hypothetical protein